MQKKGVRNKNSLKSRGKVPRQAKSQWQLHPEQLALQDFLGTEYPAEFAEIHFD